MGTVGRNSWRAICSSLEESEAEETSPSSLQKAQRVQLTARVVALLVDRPSQLPDAIGPLRASMTDPILGLDLEWKPDRSRGSNNPVALIQIASTSCCLLVRTCQLQSQLSSDLLQLLRDPSIHYVGLDWSRSDEAKFHSTFGYGRSLFARFTDVKELAARAGFQGGLARLSLDVLHLRFSKDKQISMSNWAASTLNMEQIKYAALDALLTGMLFRALTNEGSSTEEEMTEEESTDDATQCPSCEQTLEGPPSFECMVCHAIFEEYDNLRQHTHLDHHVFDSQMCHLCGQADGEPDLVCPACESQLENLPSFCCGPCGKVHKQYKSLVQHASAKGHAINSSMCTGCGQLEPIIEPRCHDCGRPLADDPSFGCPACGVVFSSHAGLCLHAADKAHIPSHSCDPDEVCIGCGHRENSTCSECGHTLSDGPFFSCGSYSKAFSRCEDLQRHTAMKHGESIANMCATCGHVECPECGLDLNGQLQLSFTCSPCSRSFKRYVDLKTHASMRQSRGRSKACLDALKSMCQVCGRIADQRPMCGVCQQHMEGAPCFRCSCGKIFKQSGCMLQHAQAKGHSPQNGCQGICLSCCVQMC